MERWVGAGSHPEPVPGKLSRHRRNKMGPLRYNTHKTSSTWVKGSNERLETVKCQEQKNAKNFTPLPLVMISWI